MGGLRLQRATVHRYARLSVLEQDWLGCAACAPAACQCGISARTSGSCLIGQQKAKMAGTGSEARKWETMRDDSSKCATSSSEPRLATISRRNARRHAVLSSSA